MTIIILCGPPGSGKSTWVDKFMRKNPEYVQVSKDLIRIDMGLMNDGQKGYFPEFEPEIKQKEKDQVQKFVELELPIIIDDTNLSCSGRQWWMEFIHGLDPDYTFRIIFFATPLDVCIQRRKGQISEKVIRDMFLKYETRISSGEKDYQPDVEVVM
jgi:tRNA uridine 5-carbamoylmethylation protein Kti12